MTTFTSAPGCAGHVGPLQSGVVLETSDIAEHSFVGGPVYFGWALWLAVFV